MLLAAVQWNCRYFRAKLYGYKDSYEQAACSTWIEPFVHCPGAINAEEHRNECVSCYRIESNRIEWNTFALLHFIMVCSRSCKHQLYQPIALRSQFCVCTRHDALLIHLFTSLSRPHSSFIWRPYQPKAKTKRTKTTTRVNLQCNVQH